MATRVRVPGTARPCRRRSPGRRAAPAGTVMPQADAPPARPARAAHGFAVMARQAAIGDRRRMGLQGQPGPRIDRPMPDSAATWWRALVLRLPARLSFTTMLSIDNIAGTAEDRPSTAVDHVKQGCRSRCRPHAPCLGNPIVARETSCCIIGVCAGVPGDCGAPPVSTSARFICLPGKPRGSSRRSGHRPSGRAGPCRR